MLIRYMAKGRVKGRSRGATETATPGKEPTSARFAARAVSAACGISSPTALTGLLAIAVPALITASPAHADYSGSVPVTAPSPSPTDTSLMEQVVEIDCGNGKPNSGPRNIRQRGQWLIPLRATTFPTCPPAERHNNHRHSCPDAGRGDQPEPANSHPQHRRTAIPIPNQRRSDPARHQHKPAVPVDDQSAHYKTS